MSRFDAVILAGGDSSRMGGEDKALLKVGGKTMLQRVAEAVGGARRTIVVGPERPLDADVLWTREEPPRGGPVAGLAAGLRLVEEESLVVLAVDMPLVDETLVSRLLEAMRASDGAVLVDAGDRLQPLAAVYRTDPLRASLEALGAPSGRSVRDLIAGLTLYEVDAGDRALDCDEPQQVALAREQLSD
jgi:molybdopterin-guanine dinucleotide biosynthesis protein A